MAKLILKGKVRGRRVVTMFEGAEAVSRTQQQFKDDTDVNKIMARFKKTGQVQHLVGRTGVYGDFSQYGDFQSCLDKVNNAVASFQQLPSDVRNRFGNDPQQLVEFLANKDNYDESVKLGLRVPRKVERDLVHEEIKGLREDLKKSGSKSPKKSE